MAKKDPRGFGGRNGGESYEQLPSTTGEGAVRTKVQGKPNVKRTSGKGERRKGNKDEVSVRHSQNIILGPRLDKGKQSKS